MDHPTQSDLKSLLASIEEVQSKILQTLGPSEQIKKGLVAELEPLKAPVFFLWELLGYGTLFLASEVDISDCFYLFNIFYPGLRTFFSKPYRHHITGAAAKNFTNRCP